MVFNFSPESALASLPSISIPFVHIIQRNLDEESNEQKFSNCVFDFFTNENSNTDVIENIEKLQYGNCIFFFFNFFKKYFLAKNYEFCEFLRESILSAQSDNTKSKPVYKFPKLSQFLIGAKLVYQILIEERTFDDGDIVEKVNKELAALEV